MVPGIVAGLVFGLAVAALNTAIAYRALKKDTHHALTGAMVARLGLDLLALGAVYMTRNILPLPFEPTMLATAVGLSCGLLALGILVTKRSGSNRSRKTGGE